MADSSDCWRCHHCDKLLPTATAVTLHERLYHPAEAGNEQDEAVEIEEPEPDPFRGFDEESFWEM